MRPILGPAGDGGGRPLLGAQTCASVLFPVRRLARIPRDGAALAVTPGPKLSAKEEETFSPAVRSGGRLTSSYCWILPAEIHRDQRGCRSAMVKPRKPRTSAPDPPVAAARLPWNPLASPVPTAVLISLAALLFRVLVSVGPYSGQGAAPKFGDYEAQRHWMELTLHLPPSDWYRNTSDNDLAYWGLDYPPLSAYQSFLHGRIINASLPEAVALRSSRGYESMESYAPVDVSCMLRVKSCFC